MESAAILHKSDLAELLLHVGGCTEVPPIRLILRVSEEELRLIYQKFKNSYYTLEGALKFIPLD